MDKLAIFSISLLLQKGIGFASFNKLLNNFGSIESLYSYASGSRLDRSIALNEKLTLIIKNAYKSMNKYSDFCKKEELNYLFIWQDSYPELLKQLPDAPSIIFYKGDLKSIDFENSISVVGTRKVTSYGENITKEFCSDLASTGITIVSGMALGVDAIAHNKAIDEGGRAVAVLASSAHIPTPETNRKLYIRILDSGGVIISETFPHQKVTPGMFAKRNHLIAGLSKATLVTEAPKKSGALITANLAFDYNRLVYAVPGDINRVSTEGNNNLIKQNVAKLVNKSEDLLEDFGLNLEFTNRKIPTGLTKEGKTIYDLLAFKPKSIDEMVDETNLSINKLIKICFELEIQGILNKQLDGKYSLSNL